jgi:GT2 family glycosyltransferase
MTLANGSTVFRRILPGSERLLREYKMLDDDFSEPRPVPQPSASCLLLRRSSLPRDHILDERFPIFFNDVQFARSFAERGLTLWVTPEAVAVHEAHASSRKLGSAKRVYVASVVRMLGETEPPIVVWLYRGVIFSQNLALWALRRPEALRGSDLWAALSGDPGSLPTRPST